MLIKHMMRWSYMKYFCCEVFPGVLLTYPENLKSLAQQERSLKKFLDRSVGIFIFQCFFQCWAKTNYNIYLDPQQFFWIPFFFMTEGWGCAGVVYQFSDFYDKFYHGNKNFKVDSFQILEWKKVRNAHVTLCFIVENAY